MNSMSGNSEMSSHMQHLAIGFVKIKSPFLTLRGRRNWEREANKIDPWRPFSPFCDSVSTVLQTGSAHLAALFQPFYRAISPISPRNMAEIARQNG